MRTFDETDTDFVSACAAWGMVVRLNKARYPDPLDTLRAVFGDAPPGCLPPDSELEGLGVDLSVLDHEISQGMDPLLFTQALQLGVLDVQAFNDSPRNREDRSDFYRAMSTMVDRAKARRRQFRRRRRQ